MKTIEVFGLFCQMEFSGEVLLGADDLYKTQRAAELEIADALELHIQEFRAGNREFDLVAIDWYILPVTLYQDGKWVTESNEGQLDAAALATVQSWFR